MKNKMKYFLIYTLTFLGLLPLLLAEDCKQMIECPGEIKYPYLFCNDSTFKPEIHCTDNPDFFATTNSNIVVRRVPLPIGISSVGNGNGLHHITHYNGIELFDGKGNSDRVPYMMSELRESCIKWNCLCIENSTGIAMFDETFKVRFIDDPETIQKFGGNPYTTPALTDVHTTIGENSCEPNLPATIIYVNTTPQFLYNTDKFPADTNAPLRQGFVNQPFLGNANLVPSDVHLYNFQQTMMHEIGHILGLWHYDTMYATGLGQYCDNDGIAISGIMNAYERDIRAGNITELSSYDKCMFKILYCADLVIWTSGIDDNQAVGTKIYPNPGYSTVRINFELANYSENVTISILDGLGQIRLVPMENHTYDAGSHSELINVDTLPTGYYYMIIDTGINKNVQPFVVVK
jgi:hypothetical protein